MLEPRSTTFFVYAESDEEVKELEKELKEFVKKKYSQGVYPRAASLTNIIRQYGNNAIINSFIR